MFDKTITIFNRYHSRLGDKFYPHVIKGVQLVNDKAQILAKYGANASDSATLMINYHKTAEGAKIGDIPYLPPKEWARLTNDELGNYITINDDAQYFDFFIIGDYGAEVVNDDDYDTGFYDYMNQTFDYVYAISSVGDYSGLLPHFEILAR